MDNFCTSSPTDKKAFVSDIGKILVQDYGKKDFYKPEEVKKAYQSSSWFELIDFSCWAMCIFTSHDDFDTYHQSLGEDCNYSIMKTEMLNGLSASSSSVWADIPDIDIDTSWLDFGDIFSSIFDGIGSFIAAIFD